MNISTAPTFSEPFTGSGDALTLAGANPSAVSAVHERPFNAIFWEKLTWLRGCLALYVMLHHVRNSLWPMVRDLGEADRWWKAWNSAMGVALFFGLDAVLLFFLVSGLSIHAATLARPKLTFSTPDFYRRRLRRLMPALVASCLPVGLVYYFSHGHSIANQWSNLLGTLTFQQGVLTDSFAENSPYWSLANEGYYYFIYPLLWMAMRRIGNTWAILLFGTAALALSLSPLGHAGTLAIYYPVWLAGAFLALTLQERRNWSNLALAGLIALVVASLATTLSERLHPALAQPLWHMLSGIALSGLLYLWLRRLRVDRAPRWIRNVLNTLGEMSYSLYLTHFAAVTAVAYYWPQAKQSFLPAATASLVAITLSLAMAWILYQTVERPFSATKRAS